MDVKTLSAMLGHVSAAIPLDICTHIADDMQTKVLIREMGAERKARLDQLH